MSDPSDMVPEADAIEQRQDVGGVSGGDEPVEGAGAAARAAAEQGLAASGGPESLDDPEVPEADALEQAAGVRDSDDDLPRDG